MLYIILSTLHTYNYQFDFRNKNTIIANYKINTSLHYDNLTHKWKSCHLTDQSKLWCTKSTKRRINLSSVANPIKVILTTNMIKLCCYQSLWQVTKTNSSVVNKHTTMNTGRQYTSTCSCWLTWSLTVLFTFALAPSFQCHLKKPIPSWFSKVTTICFCIVFISKRSLFWACINKSFERKVRDLLFATHSAVYTEPAHLQLALHNDYLTTKKNSTTYSVRKNVRKINDGMFCFAKKN